jgi:predicted DNA-binding transcriptional regulator YafY
LSRAGRLLDLIQLLRRHRYPVSGEKLAAELGVSLRTIYRDIGTLQAQGASIDGAPGLGYILRPGFMLPPLIFSEDEIEALVLGSRWVADRADARLGGAARNAVAKIAAVLPAQLRDDLDAAALLVGPGEPIAAGEVELSPIRQAIRSEHADWSRRGLKIAQPPTDMDFGRTFVALDPDGHRLRVFVPAAP